MVECVLHIGFGKTGTTALQAYLSRHPELGTPQGHRYVVIGNDGRLLHGKQLQAQAAASGHPYVSTPGLWERDDLEAIGKDLDAISRQGVPVLSHENWSLTGRKCLDLHALQRLGIKAQVVAYVRPQIEWFNSGWWQWWAWQDDFNTPADVLAKRQMGFLQWRGQLNAWLSNPNVSQLTVRLFRRNTISDFLQVMGVVEGVQMRETMANASLASLHIRILKSMPHLRGPHGSHIDAVLRKALPSKEPPPWVLKHWVMQSIVDGCRDDNERLMELLSPQDAEEMRRDERWWSIAPYSDRAVTTNDQLQATPADLSRAVEALLKSQAATISEQPATISEQPATISEQAATISEQAATISTLLNSRSYRITIPLRYLMKLMRKLKSKIYS